GLRRGNPGLRIDSTGRGGPPRVRVQYLPALDGTAQRVGSDFGPKKGREIAVPFRLGRNSAEVRSAADEAKSFVAAKEPRVAFHLPQWNRAAYGETELILVKIGPILRVKEIPRFDRLIAIEFVGRAVQPVGAGFRNHIHDATDRLPDLGGIVV